MESRDETLQDILAELKGQGLTAKNFKEQFDDAIDSGAGFMPLSDEIDHEIIMHRDVHFGGNFDVMLEYYEGEGRGCQQDYEIDQIARLADLERELGHDLAERLLENEKEAVVNAKSMYEKLRSVYDLDMDESLQARLVVDLIFTEEEDPEAEIAAICEQGRLITHLVLRTFKNPVLTDPLFPGYGRAPFELARVLGRLKDKTAIPALFEVIGSENFDLEEIAALALRDIGPDAKAFLLSRLQAERITRDNERAAIALVHFKDDLEVSEICWQLLQREDIRQHLPLSLFLAMCCSGLTNPGDRQDFRELFASSRIDYELKAEMRSVLEGWK